MLELDRSLGPIIQQRQKPAPMLGLVVGATRYVVGQHREVIRDDQVVLLIGPGPVRHRARLGAQTAFVIRDFAQNYQDIPTTTPPVSRLRLF
ncbi:hypothetical protein V3C85_05900 [Tabrizicola sp. L79]